MGRNTKAFARLGLRVRNGVGRGGVGGGLGAGVEWGLGVGWDGSEG